MSLIVRLDSSPTPVPYVCLELAGPISPDAIVAVSRALEAQFAQRLVHVVIEVSRLETSDADALNALMAALTTFGATLRAAGGGVWIVGPADSDAIRAATAHGLQSRQSVAAATAEFSSPPPPPMGASAAPAAEGLRLQQSPLVADDDDMESEELAAAEPAAFDDFAPPAEDRLKKQKQKQKKEIARDEPESAKSAPPPRPAPARERATPPAAIAPATPAAAAAASPPPPPAPQAPPAPPAPPAGSAVAGPAAGSVAAAPGGVPLGGRQQMPIAGKGGGKVDALSAGDHAKATEAVRDDHFGGYAKQQQSTARSAKRRSTAPAKMAAASAVAPAAFAADMAIELESATEKADAAVDALLVAGDTIQRQTTVRFYRQMNPLRNFPLLVLLTKAKVEKIVMQHVEQAEGAGISVTAANPIVTLVPRFPGCLVVPDRLDVDVRPESVEAQFFVTPLAPGDIRHARVEIWYEGRCIDTIETPTRVVTQFLARVMALGGVINPLMFGMLDGLGFDPRNQLQNVGPLVRVADSYFSGSFLLFGLACAAAFGAAGIAFWLANRPRKSDPVVSFMKWKAVEASSPSSPQP